MPNNPKQTFGANVKQARIESGISQEELGYRAGLHRTYISSIERGQRNVSLENVFAIAKALGVSPADLLKPVSARERR